MNHLQVLRAGLQHWILAKYVMVPACSFIQCNDDDVQ